MEQWRPIPGFTDYEASDAGRVRSRKSRPCVLAQRVGTRGYLVVNIVGDGARYRNRPVHALVLAAFAGCRPDGAVCRHLNGDRMDNRPCNLRWGTPRENARDRDAHGTTARGDRNGAHTQPHRVARGDRNGARTKPERRARGERVNTAKLTADQVRAIRTTTGKVRDVAKVYGVSKSMVSYIRRGTNWRHVV
jgi:hypothetical protein